MKSSGFSITQIVSFSLVVVLAVSLGAFGFCNYSQQKSTAIKALENQAENISRRFAFNLVAPMWNLDNAQGRKIIDSEMANRDLYAVVIWEKDGRLFAGKRRNENWKAVPLKKGFEIDRPQCFQCGRRLGQGTFQGGGRVEQGKSAGAVHQSGQ